MRSSARTAQAAVNAGLVARQLPSLLSLPHVQPSVFFSKFLLVCIRLSVVEKKILFSKILIVKIKIILTSK